jgi:murein DD-endopeptidase MepM/ murein hydrolase activator NlpD
MISSEANSGNQTVLENGRQIFGKRNGVSIITIERHGRLHRFRISACGVSALFSLLAVFLVGYFSATAYLILRDDLIGMVHVRNARQMHEYEDRIAELRANLDSVTSRQLLGQKAIEAKVTALFERQDMLGGRYWEIGKLIEKVNAHGLTVSSIPANATASTRKPELGDTTVRAGSLAKTAAATMAETGSFRLRGSNDPVGIASIASALPLPVQSGGFAMAESSSDNGNLPDISDSADMQRVLSAVGERLEQVDEKQRHLVESLHRAATAKSATITSTLSSLGIELPDDLEATGGPLLPPEQDRDFDSAAMALDQSLVMLDKAIDKLSKVPVRRPVPGNAVSSSFGNRIDPFVGTIAMHSGIDFRAEAGTPVRASATGTIVEAGYKGGYGFMVEIRHRSGLTSRYAHLSRILVKQGQAVEKNKLIGRVGTTGRSTGPHLHFEIRRNGKAVNPAKFLMAGRKLARM